MNLILLLVIGFLVFIGTYMILSINLIRIVIGISIYTHAGNLIIMSMGKYAYVVAFCMCFNFSLH